MTIKAGDRVVLMVCMMFSNNNDETSTNMRERKHLNSTQNTSHDKKHRISKVQYYLVTLFWQLATSLECSSIRC